MFILQPKSAFGSVTATAKELPLATVVANLSQPAPPVAVTDEMMAKDDNSSNGNGMSVSSTPAESLDGSVAVINLRSDCSCRSARGAYTLCARQPHC